MKTIDTIEAFPLTWPEGVHRASSRSWSRFGKKGQTVLRVRRFLKDEVRRLGGEDLIISTNMRARNDGEPIANAKEPDDPGAACYFKLHGRTVCLACDSWRLLWENLYSVAKTIEAMRAIDRWGVSDLLDRMFTGFVALTDDAGKGWASILGISLDATRTQIVAAYRTKMKDVHPDANPNDPGASARAATINEAYRQALEEVARR